MKMRMRMKQFGRQTAIAAAMMMGLSSTAAHAALLSQYVFEGATAKDVVGTRNLSAVGAGATIANGVATFSGSSSNYMTASAFGGTAYTSFTVSLWVNTATANQGGFKGLFSNNTPNTAGFSWQIDNNSGAFRAVSEQGVTITGPTSGAGAPAANKWQNVVLRKVSNTSAELYVDGVLVGTSTSNLGNLNSFRLGINRNNDNSYAGQYDGVQIWDSLVSPTEILNAGRYTPAHSWIAGKGSDVGGDNTWTPVIGGENITFDAVENLSDSSLTNINKTYTTPIGQGATTVSSTVFGGTGDVSFEMLFRVGNLTGTHVLYEIGGNGSGTSLILVDNELRFSTQTGSTANLMTLSTSLDAGLINKWLDATVVVTQSGGTGTAMLYLNGVSVGSTSIASGYTGWAGGDAWGIGRIASTLAGTLTTGFTNFDGDIALFNHYAYALNGTSAAEIAAEHLIPAPTALPAGLALLVLCIVRRNGFRRVATAGACLN
ncbi:MAG: hypothetical protein GC162_05945 [Planctomycetes bacterium]|nr:hypothetical protein [Planctomycetota bacterium]